ncbi:HD domain-containing protein [Paraclostridium sordellii]|uniref:HD domain-containing protein n=2 Tax=Paraclostridium sordellii TaxID=1505 RepID=UPI0005E4422A|nr:HD domain-containing protein [Paeniclostridium sordellii]CEQ16808.1 metal dependent phosphohydrolase [[Clostridium] sordellii] [Paeniclostridium sordellii]CEQ26542.1 metal dependent phosphohydrolase [[Clostridium] sordellii] [Paeniclostridium sordellii]
MANIVTDYIYGEFEIEDILEELINCKAVQRLKKIHQVGATYLVQKNLNVTRYEHSLGVMLLIKRLGGSLEEQIAGLLHDISHTAFSHVIDFALGNYNEDYHEDILNEVIINSEIPKILNKHGYNYEDILLDESKWTILEKESPKLCADRVDYTLRDMYRYGYIKKSDIDKFLKNICVVNGEIVTTNLESAMWFLEIYYKEVVDFFMNPVNGYSYEKLSKAIKISLDNNELSMQDVLKTDEEVFEILKSSKNIEIINLVKDLNPDVKLRINEKKYDIHIKGKVRLIDPGVYINNNVYSLSELDKNIIDINKEVSKKVKKGVYIEVL